MGGVLIIRDEKSIHTEIDPGEWFVIRNDTYIPRIVIVEEVK